MAYVKQQGGTKSLPLLRIACQMLGGEECHIPNSHSPSRCREYLGRSPQSQILRPQWVEPQSQLFAQNLQHVGNPCHRPDGFGGELSSSSLLLPVLGSTSFSPRCPDQILELSSSICVSSTSSDTQGSPEDPKREGIGHSDSPFLTRSAAGLSRSSAPEWVLSSKCRPAWGLKRPGTIWEFGRNTVKS